SRVQIATTLIEIKHAEPAGMSRLGQNTDILRTRTDVRFTPITGHQRALPRRPLCANSGLMHRNKLCAVGTHSPRGLSGMNCPGPVQSNGMCLLELVVHWNLKPNASTEHTIDLPQVTSCPGPVSEAGGFMSCGYFPVRLVGPVRALAQAFTLPAISIPHWARSGATSKVIRARSTPRDCLPSANSVATKPGNPPARPPKLRGSTSAWRSSGRYSMKIPAAPLAFPAHRSPSHRPTRTKLNPSRLTSP